MKSPLDPITGCRNTRSVCYLLALRMNLSAHGTFMSRNQHVRAQGAALTPAVAVYPADTSASHVKATTERGPHTGRNDCVTARIGEPSDRKISEDYIRSRRRRQGPTCFRWVKQFCQDSLQLIKFLSWTPAGTLISAA